MASAAAPAVELGEHRDPGTATGAARPVLVWRYPTPVRAVGTAVLGGGLGLRSWVVNAEVPLEYHQADPTRHVAAIAAQQPGLTAGHGMGMVTAARVSDVASVADDGAACDATVGVSVPTWAAAPDGAWSRWAPGTINLVCWVPAPLGDAALVNALATATEAKAQAMADAGVPGTGTASDAVVVCCPPGGEEPYGGPRSVWGARLARAVHQAVVTGIDRYAARTS